MSISSHGSSILSEVDDTSILRTELPTPLWPSSQPATGLSPLAPRSGLERSDFVHWHFSDAVITNREGRIIGLSRTCLQWREPPRLTLTRSWLHGIHWRVIDASRHEASLRHRRGVSERTLLLSVAKAYSRGPTLFEEAQQLQQSVVSLGEGLGAQMRQRHGSEKVGLPHF